MKKYSFKGIKKNESRSKQISSINMKKIIFIISALTFFNGIIAWSQNSGIGTVVPQSKLEIRGAGTTSVTSSLNVTASDSVSRLFVRDDGKVGIGTTAPTEKLHVAGSIKMVDGNQAANKLMTSDANGVASWQAVPSATVTAWGLNGNSGTTSATNFLGTTDNKILTIRTNNVRHFDFDSLGRLLIYNSGTLSDPIGVGLFMGGNSDYSFVQSLSPDRGDLILNGLGNLVGVYTTLPKATFHVKYQGLTQDSGMVFRVDNSSGNKIIRVSNAGVVDVYGSLKYVDGNQGINKVLTSDANGVATWTANPATYKKYVALLTQSGTNAPVATVLENTLGGTVVWTRSTDGIYHGTLSGVFTASKTATLITNVPNVATIVTGGRSSSDVVVVNTDGVDGTLSSATIEIRVYP